MSDARNNRPVPEALRPDEFGEEYGGEGIIGVTEELCDAIETYLQHIEDGETDLSFDQADIALLCADVRPADRSFVRAYYLNRGWEEE